MRILFYAVNGKGLGHVTRTLAIARQVRKLQPGAEILFLTSSEAEDVIYREGFAAVKVPSKTVRSETGLRTGTYSRVVELVTWNAVAGFNPHVMVVDTFPAGSIHELLPLLRWDMRKVFVFRAQRPEHARSALVQTTLPLYDCIIVPHEEGEEEIPVPEGVEAIWAGPILIRGREEALSREEARQALGLPQNEPVVYATFGGGGDAEVVESVRATCEACLRLAKTGHPVHLAVACGPLFRGGTSALQDYPVKWLEGRYPMALYLRAFDAAVAATGYNTAAELLHHGVPTVFIPFPRQVDDQEGRAARIAAAGAGVVVPRPDAERIERALEGVLDPAHALRIRRAAERLVPENGAVRAARTIVEWP